MAVNTIGPGNVYPGRGWTLGTADKLAGSAGAGGDVPNNSDHVSQALQIGGQASPLLGMAVFGAMVILTYLAAKQFGEEGTFSNIKGTAYNALFISLVAATGLPLLKGLFTYVKVPGVSTWILSA